MRRPYDLRHSGVDWRLNSSVPATEVAAWAGHSVEVLMRVYARCVASLEDVWTARKEASLRPAGRRGAGTRGRKPEGRKPEMSRITREATNTGRVGAHMRGNLADGGPLWRKLAESGRWPWSHHA
jgi:hypothetical protein